MLEINQSCATRTGGCFPGDSTGFPVTTQTGQSYVLTSSLVVTDADVTAVSLAAGATLDLNGFSITGPAVCTGAPPSCVGLGAGVGVATGEGATVRNGRIAGMGGDGVAGAGSTRVEALLIEANGDDGVDGATSGEGWQITDCRIVRNEDDGIALTSGSPVSAVIARNAIWANGHFGINVGRAVVVGNAIYTNAGFGINATTRAAIAHNALYENNGGDTQPQTSSTITETGPNVCSDGACP